MTPSERAHPRCHECSFLIWEEEPRTLDDFGWRHLFCGMDAS